MQGHRPALWVCLDSSRQREETGTSCCTSTEGQERCSKGGRGPPELAVAHEEMRAAPARALLRLCCCSSVVSAAFFPNPFADLLRQTPISVEKRNFALPRHPNLVTLNDALPVYEVPSFLSDAECDELIAATQSSQFPPIPYGAKNKIFTGTKWAAAGDPMVAPFLRQCCELFGAPETRFEPITITRYGEGQYQAQHLDARLNHQVRDVLETRAALLPAIRLHTADYSLRASQVVRDEPYFKTGGQRIAQVIVYLQAPEAGGCTKFFEPAFEGLTVQPDRGKALVFPVASLEGEADERYLHSGEPVEAGTKWILGTWLMETERSDAADMARSIDGLWKLAGGRPVGASVAKKAAAGGKKEKKEKKKKKKR